MCVAIWRKYWATTFTSISINLVEEFVVNNCIWELHSPKCPILKKIVWIRVWTRRYHWFKISYFLGFQWRPWELQSWNIFTVCLELNFIYLVDVEWSFQFQKGVIIKIQSNRDWVVTILIFCAKILHFHVSSLFLGIFIINMYLTGNTDGPSIEEYIKYEKDVWTTSWRFWVELCLKDDAKVWWKSLNHVKLKTLSNEEFEQVFLDKWSNAKKTDKVRKHVYFHG